MNILTASNVEKNFEKKPVLKGINFSVEQGKCVAFIGPSGIGKSTLFHIICGLISPDSGKIFYKDADITGKTGSVTLMPQKEMLFPFKTILENVALPLQIKGIKKKDAYHAAGSHFPAFGLAGYENSYPKELSGGMRQRASFLRAYISNKDLMLLDEPFSALDAITKYEVYLWHKQMQRQLNTTVLFITHDIEEAITLADVIYLLAGRPASIKQKFTLTDQSKEEKEKIKQSVLQMLSSRQI